ncbi:preprotein translocase subunit SecA [Patescibacteria group bacterium]|nr:preprotein translocase subunit SecA [Patescibacteria group bacterium]
MGILDKFFGDANEKYLKSLQPLVDQINDLEKSFESRSRDDLKIKTKDLKLKIKKGANLDDILPEAFALVREAAKRTLNQRHFDVQLIGGIVLHKGQIAEMRTGEGKTLTSTLAVFLNALEGKGAHVITVNDYLAGRDSVWMGQVYNYLGLTIGCLQHESAFLYDENYQPSEEEEKERDRGVVISEKFLRPVGRKEAYSADITYGTNNEFGFDYLRDNMVWSLGQKAQRGHNYAIVDEVDSILIDEARTPLIISAPAEESTDKYFQFAKMVQGLKENEDYNIDEKMRAATLTEEGINKVEKMLGVDNIYQTHGISTVHHLEAALKAGTLFKRDKDYVVKDGEVIIVDEFTGRLMFGRRYSEGLHQAIEAKEGVKVQRESLTMATVTFQNYFRMYKKLAGMTGTAATESEEFAKIYNLDVTVIPTNKPMVRKDLNDSIYKNEAGKFTAVIREIKERHQKGQPVLVGTISIEKNELLSELLEREGVRHELLNAKNHAKEAQILAQAGRLGAVTIATNMAGRGVDIVLGGNPLDPENQKKVLAAGGLHVIGTERHESRRIDNQLRGRSGRQGDAGSSRFFVCMDDDLMRIFGSDKIKGMMNVLKVPDDMPIENKLISNSIEKAQKKVEGNNFDIRKHLVEYDDVLNKQRETIYRKRDTILKLAEIQDIKVENSATQNQSTKTSLNQEQPSSAGDYQNLKEMVAEMIEDESANIVNSHVNPEKNKVDAKEVSEIINSVSTITDDEKKQIIDQTDQQKLINDITDLLKNRYNQIEEKVSGLPEVQNQQEPMRQVEKQILLRSIDTLWVEHLESVDHLRAGIGLRGYGQRDPLIEYKRETYILFQQLLSAINTQAINTLFKIGQTVQFGGQPQSSQNLQFKKNQAGPFAQKNRPADDSSSAKQVESKQRNESGEKVGRNDPCPCGATKSDGSQIKYKKCHGK